MEDFAKRRRALSADALRAALLDLAEFGWVYVDRLAHARQVARAAGALAARGRFPQGEGRVEPCPVGWRIVRVARFG